MKELHQDILEKIWEK